MAKHKVQLTVPNPIAPQRFANNGLTPHPSAFRRIGENLNYIAGIQKRSLFCRSNRLLSPDVSTGTPIYLWHGYLRTTYNSTSLQLLFGGIPPTTAYGTSQYGEFLLYNSSGTLLQTLRLSSRVTRSASGQVWPDQIISFGKTVTGLSSDTEYAWSLNAVSGHSPAYFSLSESYVREVDDSVSGVVNPGAFVDGGPIYDAAIDDLADAAYKHWVNGGSHLLAWCTDFNRSSASSITSASYVNVLDGTSSVSAASKGFQMRTDYKSSSSRDTIPVKAAFCVSISGTASFDVRLTDGTNEIAVTGITSTPAADGWTTTTGTLPDTGGGQWDLQARRTSGAGTCKCSAVSLWELGP